MSKANERYVELNDKVQTKLAEVKMLVETHAMKQADGDRNSWTFVGDLSFVNEQLGLIIDFLK